MPRREYQVYGRKDVIMSQYETIRAYVVPGVAAADLKPLLSLEQWPWFYGERLEATGLTWRTDWLHSPVPWEHWRHGRLFGPSSELAWWHQSPGLFRLRLLSQTDPPPVTGFAWGEGQIWLAQKQQQETLLHGLLSPDWQPGDKPLWGEARVPHWQSYPIYPRGDTPPTRGTLLTQTCWLDKLTPIARLVAVGRPLSTPDAGVANHA